MNHRPGSGLGLLNAVRFRIARLRERLWLKPLISGVLSLAAVYVASLLDLVQPVPFLVDVSADTIERLLEIISASMLVISVFAVGAMLSAYASASNSATPRSFPLVVGDDVSQNALSTFIGAFIFSIVALAALLNGYYEQAGRFALFVITILVFALVILSFVRWVDRIARLGRMGNTISKVEAAADAALKRLARQPTLGATKASAAAQGTTVYPKSVGYIQNIDIAMLQHLAERLDSSIAVRALPGSFATPDSPLAYIARTDIPDQAHAPEAVLEAFVIGDQRTFESDPRFGLIVLSETASRALSPAVNDPGTAIDIIGSLVRLFVRWAQACETQDKDRIDCDRVSVDTVSIDEMFDDAFNAIARDSAANVEVAIRLQQGFRSLALLGHVEMAQTAATHSAFALRHAEQSLKLPEELDAVRTAARQAPTAPSPDGQAFLRS